MLSLYILFVAKCRHLECCRVEFMEVKVGRLVRTYHLMRNTHQAWKFLIRHTSYTEVYQPTASTLICRDCSTLAWCSGKTIVQGGDDPESYLVPRTWAISVTASRSSPIQSSLQKTIYPGDYVDNFPTRVTFSKVYGSSD